MFPFVSTMFPLYLNRGSCFDHDSFLRSWFSFQPCFRFPRQPRHRRTVVLAWHDPAHHTADFLRLVHHHRCRVPALAVSAVPTAAGPGSVQRAHDGSLRSVFAGKDGNTRHQSVPLRAVGTPELAVAPLLRHGRATPETCVRALMLLVVRVALNVPQKTSKDTMVSPFLITFLITFLSTVFDLFWW